MLSGVVATDGSKPNPVDATCSPMTYDVHVLPLSRDTAPPGVLPMSGSVPSAPQRALGRYADPSADTFTWPCPPWHWAPTGTCGPKVKPPSWLTVHMSSTACAQ